MNSCVGGVGMLLSTSAYNCLEGNIVVLNSRIIVANLSDNPTTTIICCSVQRTARMTAML